MNKQVLQKLSSRCEQPQVMMRTEYPVKEMLLIKLNGETGQGKQRLLTMRSLDQRGLPLSQSLGDSNMLFCFVPLIFILHPPLSWEVGL